MNLRDIFKIKPYKLKKDEKQALLIKHLNQLTHHHLKQCNSYNNMMKNKKVNSGDVGKEPQVQNCSICCHPIDPHYHPITGEVFWIEGHNAQPVNDGRCCSICNDTIVLPERNNRLLTETKTGG